MRTLVREQEPTVVVPDAPPAEIVPPTPRPPARRAPVRIAELVGLALIEALAAVHGLWPAQALQLVLVLTVPGLLALRALRVPGAAVARFPVYVPCASLAVVTAAALGTDLIGPLLGVAQPLRTIPMVIGLEAVCVALFAIGAPARAEFDVPWRELTPRVWRAWPLALPVASAAGALILTNGHGAAVAIAAMAATFAVIVVAGLLAGRLSGPQLGLILYGAGLAAAWSFSLRGHFLYGFDINSEYHVFTATLARGVWHTSHPGDAYGAVLSVTVLPSALHALTGMSPLLLFKAAYPALLALFPPALYGLARRFVSARFAFVAAAFVVVQSYFFQQQPAIARQEIALVLFIGLIAAMFDGAIPRGAQLRLLALLGAGVAVAHYSTTYLAAGMLIVAVVLQIVVSRFRPLPAVSAAVVVALLATGGGAAAWYGAVTHSTSNVTQVTSDFREHGLDLLPNAKRGQSIVSSYLSGNAPAPVDPNTYEQKVAQQYAAYRPYVHPLHAGEAAKYRLQDSPVRADAVRSSAPFNALRLAQTVAAQLLNLLAVIGALCLVLRRGGDPLLRKVGVLGLATLGILALVRLSGTTANAYNQERAFLQTMVPLSVAMAWLFEATAQRRAWLRWPVALVALGAVAATFATTSGLRGAAFGGGTPTNLASAGSDYERFYVTAPELAGAKWVNRAPHGALIYTDRYGQLRVLSATGRLHGLLLDVTPLTLDDRAWVYASATNVLEHRARGATGSQYATYRWPRYLDDHYDTVYANGSSAVYHRP